jgi:hypothetical protein
MVPDFAEDGYLPLGVHTATRQEFEDRFVVFDVSDRRFRVYDRLKRLINEARQSAIVKRIIVAGSFVTGRPSRTISIAFWFWMPRSWDKGCLHLSTTWYHAKLRGAFLVAT